MGLHDGKQASSKKNTHQDLILNTAMARDFMILRDYCYLAHMKQNTAA
jgi:hypothetical protein